MKIIGIGHKARHGKDTCAEIWESILPFPKTRILHFADALKNEVVYKEDMPLIIMDKGKVLVRVPTSHPDDPYLAEDKYLVLKDPAHTAPFANFMHDKGLSIYYGMTEKDSPLLQLWGTDFRRNIYGESYWSDIVLQRIQLLFKEPDVEYILIPDTRFRNEHRMIKSLNGGCYINVTRFNEDGSVYQDPTRDPNHPSETDLDEIDADFEFEATSGDIERLKSLVQDTINVLSIPSIN